MIIRYSQFQIFGGVMGWKGIIRSANASLRAANREAERAHKLRVKQENMADAAEAVEDWQEYLNKLVSLHINLATPIDWKSLASKSAPKKPTHLKKYQNAAQKALDDFKPSILDKLWGGSEKRFAKLQDGIPVAIAKDTEVHRRALSNYSKEQCKFETDTSLAKRLVAGEVDAIKEVISNMHTFSSANGLGTSVDFTIKENFLHAKAQLFDTSVVPNFRRKQLASGKLSETKMPISESNELYQDYIASAAFRIAGDMLNILPLEEIYVTCLAEMLDSSTGYQVQTPILSVQFVRSTFKKLNLGMIDPSDALNNFNHTMQFNRTKGFSGIEPLQSLE